MNILVTGATGFVGKQLTIRLLELGHSVYAIIRNQQKAENLRASIPFKLLDHLFLIEGDITQDQLGFSHELMIGLENEIDTFYHMAAYLSFDPSEKEKSFEINLEGTRNALELAKKLNVNNFYHVSTAYTLGEQSAASETLHDKDNKFVNPYEESKCHAEHLVFEYKDVFDVTIFRPSIIIGDSVTGQADTNFALYGVIRSFEILKKRMDRNKELEKAPFKFLCNKEVSQNFVPVDYVVKVLTIALSHATNHTIYHITNSNPPTNQLIFDLINQSLNFTNIEMVPTDYNGELTDMEEKFNHPISVFYKYWERSIEFDDTNTRALLQKGQVQPLDMDVPMLKRIIFSKVTGVPNG